MRRLLSIVTFLLFLALLPVFAQRSGGHGGVGGVGHVGFSGHSGSGFTGHMGGGHASSGGGGHAFHGGRSLSGTHAGPGFARRGPSYRSPVRPSFRGHRVARNHFAGNRFRGDGFRGDRFHHRRFRDFDVRNCFGFNCGRWPWWSAGYYDPWLDSWWWDSHSSYDEDRAQEIQAANEMNQQSLDEQRMRRDEDQDVYARQDPAPPQQPQGEVSSASTPVTVLIFRDQHKQEVQNYAIVGQTLWAFGVSRTQKIPLADLDVAATSKANEDRGVDFRVPGTGEGQ